MRHGEIFVPLQSNSEMMYNRSLDIIFATSGMPVPTEEEVTFEAQEIVDSNNDPRSLLAAFRAIENPYLREALAWRALNYWHSLEKRLDERACYSDGDGNICFCWRDVDDAVKPIIKSALSEQVALEAVDNHEEPSVTPTLAPRNEINAYKAQLNAAQNQIYQLQKQLAMKEEVKHIGYNVEHMTINMSGGTLVQHADLVQASGEVTVQTQGEAAAPTEELFGRITQEAHDKNKAQAVENELRSASISAPKLVKAIRTNEALGYLDTQNLSSKDLYDMLNEHFGLSFTLRNFQTYRSR